MTPRIATLVPVLAAAVLAAAGCSGGSDPSASAPTSPTLPIGSQLNSPRPGASVAPSNAPSGAGSGAGSPGATGDDKGGGSAGALPTPAGNTGLGSLPAGFPLPNGTTLGRIAVRSTDITAPMEVPDGDRAAAFWKKELPAVGYKISSAVVNGGIGDIKFSGNGCRSGSDLAISGEHVAFLCRR